MLATRWDPFVELNRMRDEMNRVFGRWADGRPLRFGYGVYPPLNLWEDDDNLYVEAELPGSALDDLEIYVTGGDQLRIKGERKRPERDGGSWHRQERGYGTFSRTIELPSDVDSEKVAAELKHGVLTVTLPKSEGVRPRRIEVKAN